MTIFLPASRICVSMQTCRLRKENEVCDGKLNVTLVVQSAISQILARVWRAWDKEGANEVSENRWWLQQTFAFSCTLMRLNWSSKMKM
jgi:hypothetical protein